MKYILPLILALAMTFAAQAQRVGVVFSGGGAKGLYHIGILKALEENNIPIDYISGTSMGAIVAGLYSIGYSPDEIAEFFFSEQIKYWLSGKIESEYHYYFKHMKRQQAMVTLNLDLSADKTIAVLPTSLIPTTQLDMSFNELFAPATAYTQGDFDRLFVPFRCVASDVYNKREVVYRDGDIGFAIRASMTIPMVFKPLKVDSLLLYDGGIYNNFPWQVLEEDFAPDVFIGGKCVKGMGNPDESSIVEQIEAITMMHTDFNLPEDKGILISRVFDEVNMLDYSKAEYIIGMGYQDAMAQIDVIKSRIPRRANPEELHNRRLVFRSQLPELVFNDYRVHGLDPDQARYVQRMMGFDEREQNAFSFPEFKSEYFRILSEGEILGDYPKFRYVDSTGYFGVDLYLRTRPSFRLKLGGNISSTALNQAYIGVEYKTIRKNAHSLSVDGNFSALYTSVRAGWRTDFYLRNPFYYDFFFTNNHYNYQKGPHWTTFRKYGYHFLDDTFFSSSLGLPLGRSSALQLRVNTGWDTYKYYDRDIINAAYGSSDRTRFRYYGAQLEATKRTLNYTLYPTRGIWQSASLIAVTGQEKFTPGEHFQGTLPAGKEERSWFGGKYEREEYFSLNHWLSAGYLVSAVYTTLPDFYNPHATNFSSPAFTPTPYSQSVYMDKYRGNAFVGLGVMPIIEFSDRFYLKNSIYLFMSDEYLRKGFRKNEKMRYILSSSLVYQTPIGPASLTVTNFEETSRKWFIAFNFGYTLFNKRGLFY